MKSFLSRRIRVMHLSSVQGRVLGSQVRHATIPRSTLYKSNELDVPQWGAIQELLLKNDRRLVVLDDDPTGCQTVYDINVLLDYSVESITRQLLRDDKLFFILTNTRSLKEDEAIAVTKQVVSNVETARKNINYNHRIQYISRGDSTLRGHHPAEVNAIATALGTEFDNVILMPGKYCTTIHSSPFNFFVRTTDPH